MTELQKRAKEYLTLKGVKSTGDKFIALEVMDLLCEFAQREQLNIGVVSNNEVALKAFVEEYVEAFEDGQGSDTALYRQAKSLL